MTATKLNPLASQPPSSIAGRPTAMDFLPAASAQDQDSDNSSSDSERDNAVDETAEMDRSYISHKSQWVVLAITSGTCAAFNGVFAKLTTTALTTRIATSVAQFLGLMDSAKAVEFVIRAAFFGLNLFFNGVMWALFTKALARGTSTTQVSIINTSSNFMITAILGFLIFAESLPPLWWLGAALLVAGNVVIGRREEKDVDPYMEEHQAAGNGLGMSDRTDPLLGESIDETEIALKIQEQDDILDLPDLEISNGTRR